MGSVESYKIWIPYFRFCRVGEDTVEITPPILFGCGFVFDRSRQKVLISRRFLGIHGSNIEIPFSDISCEERSQYWHAKSGPTPGGWSESPARTDCDIEISVPHGRRFKVAEALDLKRARRVFEAIWNVSNRPAIHNETLKNPHKSDREWLRRFTGENVTDEVAVRELLDKEEIKKPTSKRRRAWFWAGVVLLSFSALSWLILFIGVAADPQDIGFTLVGGVLITVVPIGIGIYCIRRGRKAPAVKLGTFYKVKGFKWGGVFVRETSSGSEVVIKMPGWFRLIGWFQWYLPPLAIWMLGMTTKVIFDQPPGYMTVTRGHIPLFLWFLRTMVISKEEARSVLANSHQVGVVVSSGKEVKLFDHGEKYGLNEAQYLAGRIRDFAQVAELEFSPDAKFSMRVDEAFQTLFATGVVGMAIGGIVEQGTIRDGDDVEIRGYRGTKRAKVFEVDTLTGSGVLGEKIRLLIEDLTEDDVRWGDIVERI